MRKDAKKESGFLSRLSRITRANLLYENKFTKLFRNMKLRVLGHCR